MSRASRTFRVFVSSTFSDMKAEREALQRRVFPRLRRLCEKYGCRFQAIDLRWGVSEEASLDHQTMRICLDELDRCRTISPRPNFMVLLGDRYGWHPVPATVPSHEFRAILRRTHRLQDRKLLVRWYHQDSNAVPPVHQLHPRAGDFVDRDVWAREESRLRGVLERAVRGLALRPEREVVYSASATHQEILRGALSVSDAREHVFCFFRSIDGLPEDPPAADFVDLDAEGRPQGIAKESVEKLKNRLLPGRIPRNIFKYRAEWTGRSITTAHLDRLCRDAYRVLARVILDEIGHLAEVDPVEREIQAHRGFGAERSEHFVDREEVLAAAARYIRRPARRTLMLSGPSGSGKSAIMAEIADLVRRTRPYARVIARFVGATPESSDGRSLLESVCRQISDAYGVRGYKQLPSDFEELAALLSRLLETASSRKPLVILLDALDQLTHTDDADNLRWLPIWLPDHVALIVSVLSEPGRARLPLRIPRESQLQVDALSAAHARTLLHEWLDSAGRRLTSAQSRLVAARLRENGLPLYVRLVFEQVRHWDSSFVPNERSVSGTDAGLLRAFFARLTAGEKHGRMLVSRVIAYLVASKNGLAEDELIDLLSKDKEVLSEFRSGSPRAPRTGRLPFIVWSRLHADLEPYLVEKNADGATLLSFFHRRFEEVAKREYLSGATATRIHGRMAAHFKEPASRGSTSDGRGWTRRQLSELVHHQIRSRRWADLRYTLCDPDFIREKARAGGVYELLDEAALAHESLPAKARAIRDRIPKALVDFIADSMGHGRGIDLDFVHAVLSYKAGNPYRRLYDRVLEIGTRPTALRRYPQARRRALRMAFWAKLANVKRRDGRDLRSAEILLKRYLRCVRPVYGRGRRVALIELARVEYDFGYVQYLRGEFAGAVEWLHRSARHSSEAGDTVGRWISRCVEFRVRYYGGLESLAAFENTLLKAFERFRQRATGPRKNLHAERWVMNVMGHLFECAFEKDDAAGARSRLDALQNDAWVRNFAGKGFLLPYEARLAFLEERHAEGVQIFERHFAELGHSGRLRPDAESLSRDYDDFGRLLAAADKTRRARKAWREGLGTSDDAANHAWKARIRIRLAGARGITS